MKHTSMGLLSVYSIVWAKSVLTSKRHWTFRSPPFSKSCVRFCTYLPHPSTHLKPGFCGDSPCLPISIYRTTHSAFYAHKNIINSTHTYTYPPSPHKLPTLISALIRSSPHINVSPPSRIVEPKGPIADSKRHRQRPIALTFTSERPNQSPNFNFPEQ